MNHNVFDQNVTDEMNLTPGAESFLLETAKWARFLAIVGFIAIGLFVLAGIVFSMFFSFIGGMLPMGQGMNQAALGMIQITYTIMFFVSALLYFFPVLYLFRFASNAITAVNQQDPVGMETAMKNLKSHYKFLGITTIIVLGFYALAFIAAIIGG